MGFPGLVPGDFWCLCVSRYKEAIDAGVGEILISAFDLCFKFLKKKNHFKNKDLRVKLEATHAQTTKYLKFKELLVAHQ